MKKSVWIWLPVIFWAAVIFLFSSVPQEFVPVPFAGADKIFHFFEYLPLGFFLQRALFRSVHTHFVNILGLTFFIVVLYALGDEIHQLFVPGRQFSFLDVFFDGAGALLGSLIYKRWCT